MISFFHYIWAILCGLFDFVSGPALPWLIVALVALAVTYTLLPMFRVQWVVICFAVLSGFGYWAGSDVTTRFYASELRSAKNDLSSCSKNLDQLGAAVRTQNAYVEQLSTDKKRGDRLVADAKKTADSLRAEAEVLRRLKPPPGVDQCVAAQALIDSELGK